MLEHNREENHQNHEENHHKNNEDEGQNKNEEQNENDQKSSEEEDKSKKNPRGKAKKSKKNHYFGPEQEEAVKRFLNTEDEDARNRIYNQYLREPFNKMVESIIRTYNLQRKDVSFEHIHNDTLSFLMTKAHKFKEKENTKAYSYYGTICKHYLLGQLIKDDKKTKKNVSYEDVYYTIENEEKYSYTIDDQEDKLTYFIQEICDEIKKEIDEHEDFNVSKKLTNNEKKVGHAIIDILENWDKLFKDMQGGKKFNKMSILAMIREYTNLTTKDIRVAMKRFKTIYKLLKDDNIKNGTL